MELDQNTVLDYMFALVPVQLTLVICLTVFHRLKIRWPVKVNCWFCNENTKVWRQNLDWWLCPSCQQFNGFSKNGDHAYDIPEQYATHNRCTRYCSLPGRNNVANVPKRSLCTDCNEREHLKLSELSDFEPRNERHYDAELKAFEEYLENKYPLCGGCKSTVRDVLSKQALWLTRYKMLFFKQKPVKAVINKARKSGTIFRLISTAFGPIVIHNHDVLWLPFGGLLFHLCACWASSVRKRDSDILSIILWCCMTIFVLVVNLTALENVWLTAEHITRYHMMAVCALLIGFLNVTSGLCKSASASPVSFKKLKLHTRDTAAPSQSPYDNRSKHDGVFNEQTSSSSRSSSSSTESSGGAGELSTAEIKSHLAVPKQKLSITATGIQDGYSNLLTSFKNDSPYSYYLDRNVSGLSALSLSDDSSRCSPRTPPIFERRIYGAASCDLFKRSAPAKRCVLSPPKLRSVTQTSWVAGGYWQEGMMSGAPTLSRSSSQSSGFGSAGSSNFAPSREPSVHEFDRCSVVSDVTQSCYTPRPSAASLGARSFASSTAPRAHSRSSVHDATTRVGNGSQSRMPAVVRACSNAVVAENHAQREHAAAAVGGNVAGRDEPTTPPPVCPSHTSIVTSPGLLVALLCGSLILNMIVLCAMLLR